MRTPAQKEHDKAWIGNKIQRKAKNIAVVMKWLRNHPYSNCSEIFEATGVGIMAGAMSFCEMSVDEETKRNVWCINEIRWRNFLKYPGRSRISKRHRADDPEETNT